ncbi:MAG TPA: hypothetical protein VFY06_10695 [Verrucomicrobiae bacterium]|nr:hypothetical protein [Verrucomicrobiae bacterium]
MIPRITFVLVVAFWIAMNALLWRAEYGSHERGVPVPLELVCQKILTAPDASSLSVYQDGDRMGFAEFSTGVEQEMAGLDEGKPPPEGLVARAGYQVRLNGNLPLGEFTNRLKFDGRVKFSPRREWRELSLRVSTRFAAVELHSVATNQTMFLQVTNAEGFSFSHVFTFAELHNPNALVRALSQGFGGGDLDLPLALPGVSVPLQNITWDARRVQFGQGSDTVAAYRLETAVLGQPIVIYVNTLGEIMRAELPGGITATLDEWSQ